FCGSELEQNISTLDITESAQFFAQFHPEGFRIRDTCNKSSAPTRYSFGCCARAACGHAMAAPHPAINSRRLIASASGPGFHPSIEALAPYDQFHGRGLEATVEIANLLQIDPSDHILDIGSGIGGPARYFAHRFGCRVTGIDLTAELCDLARDLTRALGLEGR